MKKTLCSKHSHSPIDQTTINRRRFLIGMGALSGLAFADQFPTSAQTATPKFAADPFSLGVASGDPLPDGVVLWTRLAPDPLNGGGMPSQAVTVKWEIATDEQMKEIVQRGAAVASPALGHSVACGCAWVEARAMVLVPLHDWLRCQPGWTNADRAGSQRATR